MTSYLNYFKLFEINQKLQSQGITNIDKLSHDWYNDYQMDVIAQKQEIGKMLRGILSTKEYMALTYVI